MRRRLNKIPARVLNAAIFASVATAATVGIVVVQAVIMVSPIVNAARRKLKPKDQT